MPKLVWFRKDLRVADNSALTAACTKNDPSGVLALYVLTPETWRQHDIAACQIDFLLQNLRLLQADLGKLNIPLLILNAPYFADVPNAISDLVREHKITHCYFNNQYELDETTRDMQVCKKLEQIDCPVTRFDDAVIIPPTIILNQSRKPYTVYTPFKNAWLNYISTHPDLLLLAAKPKKQAALKIAPSPIPKELPDFTHQQNISWCVPGETAAQKKLTEFLAHHVSHYAQQRDVPAIEGTSRLSPYLNLGIISARQCVAPLFAPRHRRNEGEQIWVQEFIWREFYQGVIFHNPDICRHKAFKPNTDKLPWNYDQQLLTAWQQGQTGFPIVDAGMRQLNQTGWMHNRVRMICAMFLSKNLFLDWRLGERYFMEKLLDGDFAANNGGWQWCASTGTDAVPYFRIFNPTEQSKRFDPNGDYLRHYCPELADLDNREIHNPSDLFRGHYPLPIIDYKASRERVLTAFKNLK